MWTVWREPAGGDRLAGGGGSQVGASGGGLGSCCQNSLVQFIEETRRCAPLRGPSSSSCGGLRPSGKKWSFYVCFGQNLGIFGDQ